MGVFVDRETGELVRQDDAPVVPAVPVREALQIDPYAIRVGERIRKDLGDLGRLTDSIASKGFINPISVDENMKLICGQRRLEAAKRLGWPVVEVRVFPVGTDAAAAQALEVDENECREPFTLAEAHAYYESIKTPVEERGQRAHAAREMGTRDYRDPIQQEPKSDRPALDKATKVTGRSEAQLASYGYLKRVAGDESKPEAIRQLAGDLIDRVDAEDVAVTSAAKEVREAVKQAEGEPAKKPQRNPLMKKLRHSDSNRVIDGIVTSVEIPESSLELIDWDDIDPERIDHWVSSLTDSIRSLTTLKNRLKKELTQ
jgi:ParB-like chromosome segregation protein Spo0J